jgi:CubicO group peptidase (beta-lactamase class C family)
MRTVVAIVAVAGIAVSCAPAPPPAAPPVTTTATRQVADTDWPVGAWPEGVDRGVVDRAVDTAFAGGADQRVRAVVVVQGGKMIYQRYSPADTDVQMPSYSVAKSIASAAAGVLTRDGRFDVTAPVHAPEWPPGDPRAAITTDQLLRMSSGLDWDEGTELTLSATKRDAVAFVANHPLAAPPGTAFEYSTGSTFVAARALQDAVGGGGAALADYLQRELFDPLDMSVVFTYDDAGNWLAGFGAAASPADYAKFGELYLRDGVWQGERILPAGWVDYSRTPSSTNHRYGAGWWLDPKRHDVYAAQGYAGQQIVVDPPHDLVVVITSTNGDRSTALREAVLDAFA